MKARSAPSDGIRLTIRANRAFMDRANFDKLVAMEIEMPRRNAAQEGPPLGLTSNAPVAFGSRCAWVAFS